MKYSPLVVILWFILYYLHIQPGVFLLLVFASLLLFIFLGNKKRNSSQEILRRVGNENELRIRIAEFTKTVIKNNGYKIEPFYFWDDINVQLDFFEGLNKNIEVYMEKDEFGYIRDFDKQKVIDGIKKYVSRYIEKNQKFVLQKDNPMERINESLSNNELNGYIEQLDKKEFRESIEILKWLHNEPGNIPDTIKIACHTWKTEIKKFFMDNQIRLDQNLMSWNREFKWWRQFVRDLFSVLYDWIPIENIKIVIEEWLRIFMENHDSWGEFVHEFYPKDCAKTLVLAQSEIMNIELTPPMMEYINNEISEYFET